MNVQEEINIRQQASIALKSNHRSYQEWLHSRGVGRKYGVILEGTLVPRYKPWEAEYFKQFRTALSSDRLYMLHQYGSFAIKNVLNKGMLGAPNFVEFGCYSGGVSKMFLDRGFRVTAIDSFEGLSGATAIDIHEDGDYAVRDVYDVVDYLVGANIIKGVIPKVLDDAKTAIPNHIAIAHIDLDLYEPTLHALKFAYERLINGGIIIVDDYGMSTCPGVMKAVDEFDLFAGSKIYLPTGQMVIQKF